MYPVDEFFFANSSMISNVIRTSVKVML